MPLSRRDEIFSTFERLVAQFGLDRVTMRDLAKEVGISVGAIYRDFENKDALILAVETKWLGHVIHRNAEIVASEVEAEKKIYRIVVEHAQLFSQRVRQNQAEFELLMGALQLRYIGRRVRDVRTEVMKSMTNSVAAVLDQGSKEGVFSGLNPKHTATLLVQAFGEYFIASHVVERPHSRIARETDDLFELLMRSIRSTS